MMAKNTLPGVTLFLVSLLFFSSCTSPEQATVGTEITQPWVIEYAVDQNGKQITAPEGEYLTFSGGDAPVFYAESSLMELQATGRWVLQEDTLVLIPQPGDLQLEIDSVVYQSSAGQPLLLYYHQGELVAQQDNEALTPDEKPIVFMVEEISKNTLVLSRGPQAYHLSYESTEAIVTTFSFRNLFRGLLGMLSLVAIAWIFSSNRRAINWKVVGIGLTIQLLLAFGILQVPAVQFFFEVVGSFFVIILDFTKEGTEFLFGGFLDVDTYGFIFAFQVLPTIIFFSALTSLLFYLGIIQKIVYGLAWVMTKAMQLSGAESLSVAGNIFLGQTESPLMIKAYLENMNRSEILLVMTGGMATMAGGVLAAYISFLGGDDPVQRLIFAKHLLAASIMAAPGAVVVSKILMPQTETIDKTMEITKDRIGSNILDSISNGTTEGLKLAANVAAMLLVFIAFIAMFNYIVGWVGTVTNLNASIAEVTSGQYQELSLQFLLGYTFAPIMWLIGIATPDITLAGRLLGEKLILTEFIGYLSLAELKASNAFSDPRSIIMSTYLLCGFANFASIGIQIGGIGSLAPGKRVLLSQFGMRALLGGTLAALMSATMVGIILG